MDCAMHVTGVAFSAPFTVRHKLEHLLHTTRLFMTFSSAPHRSLHVLIVDYSTYYTHRDYRYNIYPQDCARRSIRLYAKLQWRQRKTFSTPSISSKSVPN
jgi:hypothetical protein